ncbi:hypothetical protein [Corynebacterium glaucum]|uniref:hypothetical protein n=1 Tax=Corynebacterium glaucum TaxID=187491 RepID=UPI0025B44CB1|nr:hypothetical protein [Corynebacterium glaucum]WJZ07559.1 hypothetical protein CGLAUT_05310 [Corynebacterium glaucum]
MNEHLVWTNPLAPKWRWGLIGLVVLAVLGVLAAMATQRLNTWIGIATMLGFAVLINLIHRIGTFLMVDADGLHFGMFPRPNDIIPLQHIKEVRVEELPAHHRVKRPFGSFADPDKTTVSVVDANSSTRAVVLKTRDGRTIKVGVGDNGPAAETFVKSLRKQRRGIRG